MDSKAMCLLALLPASVMLAGCGGSLESKAATACEAAAKERTSGKLLSVDRKTLAKSSTTESDGILRLQAPVTLDTGLQTEYRQTLLCRVQVSGKNVQVISATFVF